MLYGTPGTVLTRACLGDKAGAMQDRGYELPRIHILGTWVNKGTRKAWRLLPVPSLDNSPPGGVAVASPPVYCPS